MVEVAIDLLIYLTETESSIGPREISRKFDINTTSAQRLVNSLERKNCLEFDNHIQKYKLGVGLVRLAQKASGKNDLLRKAEPYLKKLRDFTGETICLNTMAENSRLTVLQEESVHELRFTAEIGKLYPLHIGAAGKAILASLDEMVVEEIIKGLNPEEKQELILRLETVKKLGYALSYSERVQGGVGIAVPLKLQKNAASISIYSPEGRIDEAKIISYTEELQKAAKLIQEELGIS